MVVPFYHDIAYVCWGIPFPTNGTRLPFGKPCLEGSMSLSGVIFKANITLKCIMQYYPKTHNGDMILLKFSTLQNMFTESSCYDVWSSKVCLTNHRLLLGFYHTCIATLSPWKLWRGQTGLLPPNRDQLLQQCYCASHCSIHPLISFGSPHDQASGCNYIS